MRKYKVIVTLVSYEYAENKNHARHLVKISRPSLHLENKDIEVVALSNINGKGE